MKTINLNQFSNSNGSSNLNYKVVYDYIAKVNKETLTSADEKKVRKLVQKAIKDSEALPTEFITILQKATFFVVNADNPKLQNYLKKFPLPTIKKRSTTNKKKTSATKQPVDSK